jgi:lysophospholipase L1-like esterase
MEEISMKTNKWVALWGNAPSYCERRTADYTKDTTLRYQITPTLSGPKIRLHFHNVLGAEDVTLSKVSVAISADRRAIVENSNVPVTFGGERSVTIAKGTEICSDEIPFEAVAGKPFSVSIYLADYTDMTSAVAPSGPLVHNCFAKGDYTEKGEIPIDKALGCNYYYFLYTIDVLTEETNHALVAFGDSITAQSWPDWLTLRLLENGTPNCSVIRRGIGGSRILREYSCHQTRHYGQSGLNRFARDIRSAAGADTVVVLHGINDIIHPDGVNPFRPMCDLPSAEQLIEGLRFYIQAAHDANMKIYLATILPFKGWRTYDDARNQIRMTVNQWIRENNEADGFVDFEEALKDSSDQNALAAPYASADKLHPSTEGAQEMALTAFNKLFAE